MSNVICPACGSHKITTRIEKQRQQLTLGPEFEFGEVVYECEVCGADGDFTNENETKYLAAHKTALNISVKEIVESLSKENSISMAYMERAFELPSRTVTRWKSGDFSSTAVALLRTVKTFPWLTEVADNHFDKRIANKIMLRESFQLVQRAVAQNENAFFSGVITESPTSFSAFAGFTLNKSGAMPKLKVAGEI